MKRGASNMLSRLSGFRDRDAPVTREGLIFRVYGYDHPPNSCICDLEYASERIYRSSIAKAVREGRGGKFYKFYSDDGLKFIYSNYPQYTVYYKPLRTRLVGLSFNQVIELRLPDKALLEIIDRRDPLVTTLRKVLDLIIESSKLKLKSFGVFGSLLHDFYHPSYSDLDLIIYGSSELRELIEALKELYRDSEVNLVNEFERVRPRDYSGEWRFKSYSIKDYWMHERRKAVYGMYFSRELGRWVKVEFEAVRKWGEVKNEYSDDLSIRRIGWIEAKVRVVDDSESFFNPAIYKVEVLETSREYMDLSIGRVVSFVEEFRGQLLKGETGLVKGWLEELSLRGEKSYQITLSYGENYYDQVLKLHEN